MYEPKDVEACVQECFGTPAGRFVLDWLTELYCNYTSKGIVMSGAANVERHLAYKCAQQDLVLNLKNIFENGIDEQPKQQEEEEY